jgi:hypothetical protein
MGKRWMIAIIRRIMQYFKEYLSNFLTEIGIHDGFFMLK